MAEKAVNNGQNNEVPCGIRQRLDYNADFRLDWHDPDEATDGYQLKWIGKDYARFQFGTFPDTIVKPDAKHNSQPQNQNSQNIFITGDNLQALKHLQSAYRGQVDMIYIDPPYNTGGDGFVYNDKFEFSDEVLMDKLNLTEEQIKRLHVINGRSSHSAWLTFMYPRLRLAKELLKDTGVIFISIDDNEQANLKLLCDEIFGERNFVASLHLEISLTQGMKVGAAQNGAIVKNGEFVLVYAKDKNNFKLSYLLYDGVNGYDKHFSLVLEKENNELNLIPLGEFLKKDNKEIHVFFDKEKLSYTFPSFCKLIEKNDDFRKLIYDKYSSKIYQSMMANITIPSDIQEKLQNKKKVEYENYILQKVESGNIRQLLPLSETLGLTDDYEPIYGRRRIRGDMWKGFYADMMNVAKEGGVDFKNGKKPVRLIKQLAKWAVSSNKSALIMDFFAGSATTAHAVMQLNKEDGGSRRYIMVQLDEPHRIKKDGSSYKNIIEKLNPQMIMRFGATFPEIQQVRGRKAVYVKDYYQKEPQFDLCAVDAFNQDLVKGVAVQYPALPENEASERYRVKKAGKSKLILTKDNIEYSISIREALPGFDGNITYEGEQKLSNELELSEGMELVKGVFSNNYQEILIRQAINAHFETEISNFQRHGGRDKVKTITLFFIDSIKSYREENGWLKQTFENSLKEKLEELLVKYKSGEYHDYLLATKNNIAAAHGGYFAQDWSQPDDSVAAEELQDILHKERTLTFKKEDGSWNIRRFFFSKWTLREGWDNPNVFTICKLRSSGSETSKIQEAGRGLRLPVDEHGNRLADEEWKLNFIIGYDEKEFAQKLIGEINADAKIILDTHKITDEMIKTICDARKMSKNDLLTKLDNDGIINRSNEFKPGGFEKLIEQYPELSKVKQGKITSPGLKQKKIQLRTENWQKITDFWQQVSKRYMLCFERLAEGEIESLFGEVLDIDGIFDDNRNISITVNATAQGQEGSVSLTQQTITMDNPGKIGALPYNDFVKRVSKRTSIPPQTVHKKLWQKLMEFANKGLSKEAINAKINHNTLEKIIADWHEKFAETFAEKYHYDPLNFTADTSIIKDGSFLQELPYGLIGTNTATDIVSDNRNLYEVPLAYDSEIPEHEILRIAPPQQIIVFGKIPRRAIKVPVYTGGSTTPDFIYAVQQADSTHLYILIETKSQDMRGAEKRAVEAQNRLFKNLKNVNVEWHLIKSAAEVQELLENFAKQK